MRGRSRGSEPAELLRLKQRFENWRASRSIGERIPDRLWDAAAKSAVDHGLNRTAKLLKLDYYSLKKRLDSVGDTGFIELPSPSFIAANECVIELQDGTGASMRMHLKGTHNVPDLLALGRSFWNAD